MNGSSSHRWLELGALVVIILVAVVRTVDAAPTQNEDKDLSIINESGGCYYNYMHYSEGDRIMTNEPCLNCTCHNQMLMCYLRVCPFTKPIGQDCTVEKREDQCCPIITCPEVPVELEDGHSTAGSGTEVGHLDQYGCTIDSKFYTEGSQVPPSPHKPCELCYCIRNMTTCVMQECTLHVEGCQPVYHKGVCCPVRYECDHDSDMPLMIEDETTTTVRPTPGFMITTTQSPTLTTDCIHNGLAIADGGLVTTDNPCDHCYCMRGDIVCVVMECGTPLANEGKNCTAVAPEKGECCPKDYICDGDLVKLESMTTEHPGLTTTATFEISEGAEKAGKPTDDDVHTRLGADETSTIATEEHEDDKLAATDLPTVTVESAEDEIKTAVPDIEDKESAVTEGAEAVPVDATQKPKDGTTVSSPRKDDEYEDVLTTALPDAHDKLASVTPTAEMEDEEKSIVESTTFSILKEEQPTSIKDHEEDVDQNTVVPDTLTESHDEQKTDTPVLDITSISATDKKPKEPSEETTETSTSSEKIEDLTETAITGTLKPSVMPSEEEKEKTDDETSIAPETDVFTRKPDVRLDEGVEPDTTARLDVEAEDDITLRPKAELPSEEFTVAPEFDSHDELTTSVSLTSAADEKTIEPLAPAEDAEVELPDEPLLQATTVKTIDDKDEFEPEKTESPIETPLTTLRAPHEDDTLNEIIDDIIKDILATEKPSLSDAEKEKVVTDHPTKDDDLQSHIDEDTKSTSDRIDISEPTFDREKLGEKPPTTLAPSPTETLKPETERDDLELPPAVIVTELPEIEDMTTIKMPEDEIILPSKPIESDSHVTIEETRTQAPEEESVEMNTVIPESDDRAVEQPSATDDVSAVKETTIPSTRVETSEDLGFPQAIPGEGDCLFDGKHFLHNSIIPSTENCIICICLNSIVKCNQTCDVSPDQQTTDRSEEALVESEEVPSRVDSSETPAIVRPATEESSETPALVEEMAITHAEDDVTAIVKEFTPTTDKPIASEEEDTELPGKKPSVDDETGEDKDKKIEPHTEEAGIELEATTQVGLEEAPEDLSVTKPSAEEQMELEDVTTHKVPFIIHVPEEEDTELPLIQTTMYPDSETPIVRVHGVTDADVQLATVELPEDVTKSAEFATELPVHETTDHEAAAPEDKLSSVLPEEPVTHIDIGKLDESTELPKVSSVDDSLILGVTESIEKEPSTEKDLVEEDKEAATDVPKVKDDKEIDTTVKLTGKPEEDEFISTPEEADADTTDKPESQTALPESEILAPVEITTRKDSETEEPKSPVYEHKLSTEEPSIAEQTESPKDQVTTDIKEDSDKPVATTISSLAAEVDTVRSDIPSMTDKPISEGDEDGYTTSKVFTIAPVKEIKKPVTEMINGTMVEIITPSVDIETEPPVKADLPYAIVTPVKPDAEDSVTPLPEDAEQKTTIKSLATDAEDELLRTTVLPEEEKEIQMLTTLSPVEKDDEHKVITVTPSQETSAVTEGQLDTSKSDEHTGAPKLEDEDLSSKRPEDELIKEKPEEEDVISKPEDADKEPTRVDTDGVETETEKVATDETPLKSEKDAEKPVDTVFAEKESDVTELPKLPESEDTDVFTDKPHDLVTEEPISGTPEKEDTTPKHVDISITPSEEEDESTEKSELPEEQEKVPEKPEDVPIVDVKETEISHTTVKSAEETSTDTVERLDISTDAAKAGELPEEIEAGIDSTEIPKLEDEMKLSTDAATEIPKPEDEIKLSTDAATETPIEEDKEPELVTDVPKSEPKPETSTEETIISPEDASTAISKDEDKLEISTDTSVKEQESMTDAPKSEDDKESELSTDSPKSDVSETIKEESEKESSTDVPKTEDESQLSTELPKLDHATEEELDAEKDDRISTEGPKDVHEDEISTDKPEIEKEVLLSTDSPKADHELEVPTDDSILKEPELSTDAPKADEQLELTTGEPVVQSESVTDHHVPEQDKEQTTEGPEEESKPDIVSGVKEPEQTTDTASEKDKSEVSTETPDDEHKLESVTEADADKIQPEISSDDKESTDRTKEDEIATEKPIDGTLILSESSTPKAEEPKLPETEQSTDAHVLEVITTTKPDDLDTRFDEEHTDKVSVVITTPSKPDASSEEVHIPVDLPTEDDHPSYPEEHTSTSAPSQTYGAPASGSGFDPSFGQMPSGYPTSPDSYDDYEEQENDPSLFGPGTCRYGGKLYVSAQQIPRDDPCDFCFCFRSDIICLQQSCPPPINGCHEESIEGFCCPRYECPVSMATVVNITTSTTTTTTTLPPHFNRHVYRSATKGGCFIDGRAYQVGENIERNSGPCMQCSCGADGQMQCNPLNCSPEPMLRQMIEHVISKRRRR